MEADERLIAGKLVPCGNQGATEVALKCRTAGGMLRWPTQLPLHFKVRLLPVGFREHDLNNPVL